MLSTKYVYTTVFLSVVCRAAIALPVPIVDNSDNANEHRECVKGAVDLVFVVDESYSIGGSDFNLTLTFLANLINSLDIGPSKSRYNAMQQARDRIIATMQVKGGTDIANGMNMASSNVFTPEGGDRRDVPNMMLVLTDGQDSSDVVGAYRAAAAKNITVAVIGIGNAVSSTQLRAIVGGNLANVYNVTNFKLLDSLTKEICIGTLKSAEIPWTAVLSAVVLLPVAAIICGQLFIIPLQRRKSKTREEIIADATGVERKPLTMETVEQDYSSLPQSQDVHMKPAILMPPFRSPKPPPADKKWNTTAKSYRHGSCADDCGPAAVQNETAHKAAIVSRPAPLPPKPKPKPKPKPISLHLSPNVPPIKPNGIIPTPPPKPNQKIIEDIAGVLEADASQSAKIFHYIDPVIDTKVKLATKRQALLPPKAKVSQNFDPNFTSDTNADVQMKTAEIRRPLLPPNAQFKAAVVLKEQSETADVVNQMQIDEPRNASKMRNRTSNSNDNSRNERPSQIWGGIASDDTDSSKTAVVIRRNDMIASGHAMGRESGIGYGKTDAAKIAQLVRVGEGKSVKQKAAMFTHSPR